MRYTRSTNNTGFTLVEMLVIAPVILLTIATFIGVLIHLTGETLMARTSNSLAYTVQDALDTIERDIALSGAFLATNSVAANSPQRYNNTSGTFANASASTGTMIILNVPATTEAPSRGVRKVIPLSSLPEPCANPQSSKNQVMTYNIIYFVKDSTLWRRTLMPSNYLTRGCDGAVPWQQPSCAPGQSGGMCRTEDMKLLEGIAPSDFTVQYFSSPQSSTPMTIASSAGSPIVERQNVLSNTRTAAIHLRATRTVAGKEVVYNGSMRVSRVGPLMELVTPVP